MWSSPICYQAKDFAIIVRESLEKLKFVFMRDSSSKSYSRFVVLIPMMGGTHVFQYKVEYPSQFNIQIYDTYPGTKAGVMPFFEISPVNERNRKDITRLLGDVVSRTQRPPWEFTRGQRVLVGYYLPEYGRARKAWAEFGFDTSKRTEKERKRREKEDLKRKGIEERKRKEIEDGKGNETDAVKEIGDGMRTRKDAGKEIVEGKGKETDAVKEIGDGMRTRKDAGKEIVEGKGKETDSVKEIEDGMRTRKDAVKEIVEGKGKETDAVKEIGDGMRTRKDAGKEIVEGKGKETDSVKEIEEGKDIEKEAGKRDGGGGT